MIVPKALTRTRLVALLPTAAVVLSSMLLALGCTSSGGPEPTRTEHEASAAAVPVEPVATEPEPVPPSESEREPRPVSLAPVVKLEEVDDEELDDAPEGAPGPLEQALAECDSARDAWRRGAFDEALASLDRAYSVLLQMPDNGDPVKAQEKADLRHLISKRVVEIYASRQTAVGELDRAIPLVMNANVEAEIRSFQGGERSFFVDSYRRSGRYRPMIVDELKKAGIPEQLSWLPLIESGYKVRALSTARALGLWQFISSTGYRYGLRRDATVDERMDPEKATRSAIAYLTDLHGMFGDWLTAIAAYNCGEQNVLRTINSQKINYLDQFWDLYSRLPRETARYVPRFLATLHIVNDPASFGFDLPEPDQPIPFEVVQVERSVRLSDLERSLGLPGGILEELNPELRHRSTPKTLYDLRVPTSSTAQVVAGLGALPQWTPPVEDAVGVHRVRSGETLGTIARRYGTSVERLKRLNNLSNPNRLSVGQRLRVPQRGGGGQTAPAVAATAPAAGGVTPAAGTTVRHTVRRGENLWQLAERYRTTVERIRQQNQLPSTRLQVGQNLTITVGDGMPAAPGGRSYVVRRGDTPSSIARLHGVDLDRLLGANGLSRRSTIFPGQTLVIP